MDLNIIIQDCDERDSKQIIEKKLSTCYQLGYKTVAISIIIDLNSTTDIPDPPEHNHESLKVYTRLTARCSETIQLYRLKKSTVTSKYDLIALEPQNGKMLQYIASGSAELDILTLNLSNQIEFSLFKASYKVIEKRGVCIEINYGPSQLGSSIRRNIICNGQNLVEKTSKNLIFSSGVRDWFRFRSPKDVIALASLFMLPPNRSHEAVFKNGIRAIDLSIHRKQPAASAILKQRVA